ncbi:MAG: iron ABC transporter permease [Erysipelotrichaceae bacterium]|nr:iron ABC transporter permease [Erysipelotrichaceae bacterium]
MLINKKAKTIVFLSILLLLLVVIGCSIGRYPLSFTEVVKTLIGQGTYRSNMVIFSLRLPKILLAIMVGIGMGISGTIMQRILHNDLASPGTLGVADGSSLFVTIYIALIAKNFNNPLLLPILAFMGGVLSAIIIFVLGTKNKKPISSIKLIMTGVAMSACYSAISIFIMYLLDETQLEFLYRWQAGDLWGSEWNYLIILGTWLSVFIVLAIYSAKILNVIGLGSEVAIGLGVKMKSTFIYLALIAIAMSSSVVAFGGNFFFLGLIGPHIAKKLIGIDALTLIPVSGIVSAIIIVAAIILVENVPIFINIPTGIIINILSVPYFLYLLIERDG